MDMLKRLSGNKSELTVWKLIVIIVVLGAIAAVVILMVGEIFSGI
jgi:hypothetical protein